MEAVLASLGLAPTIVDQPMTTLSGGQAAKASLASLLLAGHDVVLLDEPTNDLDLAGLDRLEAWVLDQERALVLVSHDRAFLERTVTDVVELDEHTRRATTFGGGWLAYQEEKATARRHAQEAYDEYTTQRDALAGRARRERQWSTTGYNRAKRQPSDNDKNIRHFRMEASENLAAKARRTEQAMARLEVVDKPWEPWDLRFSIDQAERGGERVAALDGAVVRRGDFVLGPIDVAIGLRRAGRHRGRQRQRQDDAPGRAARPGGADGGRALPRSRCRGRRGRAGPPAAATTGRTLLDAVLAATGTTRLRGPQPAGQVRARRRGRRALLGHALGR